MTETQRTVEVFETKVISNSQWQTTSLGVARFCGWGVDYEEFEEGPGPYSAAIVEFPDGKVQLVRADQVRFVDKGRESDQDWRLREISGRMEGQDNLATKDPIFIVEQRRRIYGMDSNYSDNIAWLVDDECLELTDPNKIAEVDAFYDANGVEPPGLSRVAYLDIWESVQPFFSRLGAEAYIDCNRHNLTDPRVYVESAYRNDEWTMVREVLVAGGGQPVNGCGDRPVPGEE